jgi:predicted lipoprotein
VKRRTWLMGVGSTGVMLATSCGPSEIPDRRRELMRSWGEAFLLANYRDLAALAAELQAKAVELRDAPNSETLAAAQSAWWQARARWKRADVFAFGPYSEEPARLGPKIDFWPARPATIEDVLADESPLDAEGMDLLGAPAKGLTALEYLLFAEDALQEFESNPRRSDYVHALAFDLVLRSEELWRAWHPSFGNFLGELLGAGRESTRFPTLNAALGEFVNRIGYTLENARTEKLGRPLGDTADGTPRPELVESVFSQRSLEDLQDTLRGVALLLLGEATAGIGALDSYLEARGRHLGGRFRAQLAACHAAIDGIPAPLASALVQDPESVRTLMRKLSALQRLVQVDLVNALSLTVGFNDNDGD